MVAFPLLSHSWARSTFPGLMSKWTWLLLVVQSPLFTWKYILYFIWKYKKSHLGRAVNTSLCWQSLWRSLIFQQNWAPAQSAKSTNILLSDHSITELHWPANMFDLNSIENLRSTVDMKVGDTRPGTGTTEISSMTNCSDAVIQAKKTWSDIWEWTLFIPKQVKLVFHFENDKTGEQLPHYLWFCFVFLGLN